MTNTHFLRNRYLKREWRCGYIQYGQTISNAHGFGSLKLKDFEGLLAIFGKDEVSVENGKKSIRNGLAALDSSSIVDHVIVSERNICAKSKLGGLCRGFLRRLKIFGAPLKSD